MQLIINLREASSSSRAPSSGVISGARSEPIIIEAANQVSLLGVHFKPGGALPFLGLPAGELHNTHASLDDLWGRQAVELHDGLLQARTAQDRFLILERFLMARAVRSVPRHPAVDFALKEFQAGPDTRAIAVVADKSGLSRRRSCWGASRAGAPIHKVDGWSPQQAGAEWIDAAESVDRSRFYQFKNGCFPLGSVELDESYGDPDDPELERLYAKFFARLQGESNYGRPIIMPPGAKYQPLMIAPNEMAYVESADQLRDWVLSLFGVPKEIVGLQPTGSDLSWYAPMLMFMMRTINPLLKYIGQVMTAEFQERYEDEELRLWWNDPTPNNPTQVNSDIMTDIAARATCPNEVRARRGLPPWPGGDDPITPMNESPMPLSTGQAIEDYLPTAAQAEGDRQDQIAQAAADAAQNGNGDGSSNGDSDEAPKPTSIEEILQRRNGSLPGRKCGGEGGKPGPCPEGGEDESSSAARKLESRQEIDEWGKGKYKKWADSLDASESHACAVYASKRYATINADLRAGKTGEYADAIDSLDAALGKAELPEHVVAYRGIGKIAGLKKGAVFQDQSLISIMASLAKNCARERSREVETFPSDQVFSCSPPPSIVQSRAATSLSVAVRHVPLWWYLRVLLDSGYYVWLPSMGLLCAAGLCKLIQVRNRSATSRQAAQPGVESGVCDGR